MKNIVELSRRYTAGLLLACLLSLTTGCRKSLLDTIPVTNISSASAFSTPEKILAQVNGLYGQLSNASFYGGRYLVFNEQRGEEFSQNDGNNSTGANVWNQSISASGDFVNAVWSVAYRTINAANLLIDNLATSTVVNEALRNQYIAEARFIRALAYFSLVQNYARPHAQNAASPALPLRLTGNASGGVNDFTFSTVTQVYDQIISDLNAAESNLPVSYSSALLTSSRAHKATAIALKTRVYLARQDYPAVVTEAKKLVPAQAPYQYTEGSITHRLEGSVAALYTGTYTGVEAIFTIPFINPAEAPGNQSSLANNYLTPVLYLNPGGIITHSVFGAASGDARKSLIITSGAGLSLLNKFQKNSVPFTDYLPIIRYAEVLLNYAEAAAENNDLATATALLQAVRHRSDPAYTFTTGTGTREELIQTILLERRIELLGEGHRVNDLVRRLLPLPAKSGNAGTAPEVPATAANYVWPIPSNEVAYNTLAPR